MFYIIFLILSWIVWFIWADKSRFQEIFPVSLFAVCIAGIADVITYHYPLWDYNGSTNPIIPDISDNLGIYLVVTYLFIQWLPEKKTFFNLFRYFFIWTAITISIE